MDTEFTGLHQNTSLISLALYTEIEYTPCYFYAEFKDYNIDWKKLSDDFGGIFLKNVHKHKLKNMDKKSKLTDRDIEELERAMENAKARKISEYVNMNEGVKEEHLKISQIIIIICNISCIYLAH